LTNTRSVEIAATWNSSRAGPEPLPESISWPTSVLRAVTTPSKGA
jgi:hypothetical protein